MSIRALPPGVIAQIKSSTAITSLNGVVVELVKNSLDAGATEVDISVDYARGGCVVEDNGLGILPSEFGDAGSLGKLYHSSKVDSHTPVHGGHGTFLASLSALSFFSITSHHHLHRSHNTLSMHKSQVISFQTPAPPQQHLPSFDHGTRVAVRDLFGNIPVRMKQRAIIAEKHGGNSREWESLKRDMVSLILGWPLCISISVRESGINQKMAIRSPEVQAYSDPTAETSKICKVLLQASFITAQERSSWVPVEASTTKMKISGAISLEPSATKHVQFIAFGIQPLMVFDRQSILHDEINHLFQNSAFGNEEVTEELDSAEKIERAGNGRYGGDVFTGKELKGRRKGVDRWPMFYINIQHKVLFSKASKVDMDTILDDKGDSLSDTLRLIQTMVFEFLTKNHFRARVTRGRSPLHKKTERFSGDALVVTTTEIARGFQPLKSSSAKRKLPSKKYLSNSDLLGANVNIPSFHGSPSNSESPFDGWSRIKSGISESKSFCPKDAIPALASRSSPARPTTAPSPQNRHSSVTIRSSTLDTIRSPKSSKPSIPFVSSTGKIMHKPFEDETALCAFANPNIPVTPHGIDTVVNGVTVINWTNPVTQVTSLVNQRTGLCIPASKPNVTRRSSPTNRLQLSSRKKLRSTIDSKVEGTSPWIDSLLTNWENAIFKPAEVAIPEVSLQGNGVSQRILHGPKHNCSQLDIDQAFKDTHAGVDGQITKDALGKAEVISQVDKKFILVKLKCGSSAQSGDTLQDTLVIIDQHAADERIRLEALLSELCTKPELTTSESNILTITLDKPLTFDVPSKETQLLRTHREHFKAWGIIYDEPNHIPFMKEKENKRLLIRALPPGIAERCKRDPHLLIDLIRTEAWKVHSSTVSNSSTTSTNVTMGKHFWLTKIHTCPQGILDMLSSRACRSAIMFNDELSKERCDVLVKKLADCAFPFQCAHGRPSLVPVVDLGRVENVGVSRISYDDLNGGEDNGSSFWKEYRRWKMTRKSEMYKYT